MSKPSDCCRTLTVAFEEAALALGGVAAVYPVPDEMIWELARTLDLIHERACGRCGAMEAAAGGDSVDGEHPAIIHLLAQLHGREVERSDRGPK